MSQRPLPPLPELARRLRSGELPLGTLLADCAARFAELEGEIHAFVPEPRRFERLEAEARALAERFPDPLGRPPLFGVPVGVKDIFHVDGFETRAGSELPPEALAGPEAESVTRLRSAGALILGKTVTTEFASFAPGPTRNPHRPGHTPGGSSSGSAAAVAAGLAPLTLGSQTIGSIARPASFCGVVGFKPSYDRISRAGVIPVSPFLDHVGCFTADAAGARLAASLLIADWQERPIRRWPVLGIPEGPYLARAGEEGLGLFRAACERLAGAGYEVHKVPAMADFEAIERRHHRLFDGEMARTHEAWFAHYRELYRPKTRATIERGREVSEAEMAEARRGRAALASELAELARSHGVDLWISPSSTGPAPEGLEATGDPVMNLPWTQAGFPTLTLPAGRSQLGLPMGLQLADLAGGDERLLAWGLEIEQALR
ncbi:MAG: amidase [Thermoanaerobaculia bacterium]